MYSTRRRAAALLVTRCAVASLATIVSVRPGVASAQTPAKPLGPDPNGVPVHLDATAPATWFYYRASDAVRPPEEEDDRDVSQWPYLPLCASPCDVNLVAGAYRIAVADGNAKPVEAPGWVVIGNPATTVNGSFGDRRWLRTAGWIALPVLAVAGIAMMVAAGNWGHSVDEQCGMSPSAPADTVADCNHRHAGPDTLWSAGLVTAIASLPTGIFLGTRPDSAEVRVIPGGASPTGPATRPGETHERSGASPGVSIELRF